MKKNREGGVVYLKTINRSLKSGWTEKAEGK
jgi:hypothetical protein